MNDTLHDLMRESADTIPTSAPPIGAITRAGHRRRTTRLAVAATAVAVLAGTAAVALPPLAGDRTVAPAAPTRDYGESEVPVFLPESAFEVGVDEAPSPDDLEGELRSVMDDRCLDVGPERLLVFWPRGWEGLTHADGTFELLDQDGKVVARVGDRVRVEGIRTDGGTTYSGEDVCASGATGSFMVTSLEVLNEG